MKHLAIVFAYALSSVAFAQEGDIFPRMEVENLKRRNIVLPDGTMGKHTLIGLAFSRKSEADLKNWYGPIYYQLIKKPGGEEIFSFGYDVNVYFIPMLTGAKKAVYDKVIQKVEKEVDPKLHGHILFYKGSMKTYQDALNIGNGNVPYFYLLDESGKIVYATEGAYAHDKLQKIIDELPFD